VCIGIPKRVRSLEGFEGEFAWVEREDGSLRERVNMMLVGPQSIGAWVLTSLGMAREELTEDEAATINDAIAALEGVLDGSYDAEQHFADLRPQP
jgi:hydrogenase expression/formation protein HypC